MGRTWSLQNLFKPVQRHEGGTRQKHHPDLIFMHCFFTAIFKTRKVEVAEEPPGQGLVSAVYYTSSAEPRGISQFLNLVTPGLDETFSPPTSDSFSHNKETRAARKP